MGIQGTAGMALAGGEVAPMLDSASTGQAELVQPTETQFTPTPKKSYSKGRLFTHLMFFAEFLSRTWAIN